MTRTVGVPSAHREDRKKLRTYTTSDDFEQKMERTGVVRSLDRRGVTKKTTRLLKLYLVICTKNTDFSTNVNI